MKTKLVTRFCLLSILALGLLDGVSRTAASNILQENDVPPSVDSKAQRLMTKLQEQGFEVSRGYMRLYTEEDCPYSFAQVGTCAGTNPAAPYVTFAVPPWPKEFVDPATDEAWGPKVEGFSTIYRFDPREAIVILGILPPPAAYFGLQSYLFTRQDNFDRKSGPYQYIANNYPNILDGFFTIVPQNPKRVLSYSSLSNSINNVVIEKQSDAAFDQERFFIITPDQFMDKTVRTALGEILVADEDIFTEPIPGTMRTGLNKPSDDFVTLIRYAMPDDGGGEGTASDTWRKELPLVVLRIRDTSPGRRAKPFPATVLEGRTANNELDLEPDRLDLVRAVAMRWGQPCVDEDCADRAIPLSRLQLPPWEMVGPDCIEIGMNCNGDTQDTAYQYSTTVMMKDDVVYAVAGTLGTATGNATYVGLGLTKTMKQLGFANLSDEDLDSTASAYEATVDNTDKFYLYYFARNCSDLQELTDHHCMEISKDELPPCNDPTSKACDNLKFSVRDYIRPETQRGPATELKLPSVVVRLHRP